MASLLLGSVALAEGPYAEAERSLEERISILREAGDQLGLGQALAVLGCAARRAGHAMYTERHL